VGAPRRSAGASRLVFERRHLPLERADKPPSGFWGAGELSARKNRPKAIAYTDLLCAGFSIFF